FSWSGVRVHAVGASALRVRVSPIGRDAVALALTDAEGTPVLTVDSLTLRPLSVQQLSPAGDREPLLHLAWNTLPVSETPEPDATQWAVIGDGSPGAVGTTVETF